MAIVRQTGLNKHTYQGKECWVVETEYNGIDRFRVKKAGFRWHKNHSTSLEARCLACQAAIGKKVWWTDDIVIAAKCRRFAVAEVTRAELEAVAGVGRREEGEQGKA